MRSIMFALRPTRILLLGLGLAACGVRPAWATPTGLNNIPTAEVVGEHELVLQAFSEFGREREPAWFDGFKYGPAPDWEVGLDDLFAGPGSAGGPTLQAKYRTPLGNRAAMALGAANISNDRSRHGDVFPYVAVSGDLGPLRLHVGRSWQADNQAWFLGMDAAASADLTLRADWIQAADGEESIASLGFICTISPRWLVEGWASFPTEEDAESSYIVKLDFVVPLGGP